MTESTVHAPYRRSTTSRVVAAVTAALIGVLGFGLS